MATITGTYAMCNGNDTLSISMTCHGSNCTAFINRFTIDCEESSSDVWQCSNGVVCSSPPFFSSDFAIVQTNETVSQTQQVDMNGAQFSFQQDGTGNATVLDEGTASASSTNPSSTVSTSATVLSSSVDLSSSSGLVISFISTGSDASSPNFTSSTISALSGISTSSSGSSASSSNFALSTTSCASAGSGSPTSSRTLTGSASSTTSSTTIGSGSPTNSGTVTSATPLASSISSASPASTHNSNLSNSGSSTSASSSTGNPSTALELYSIANESSQAFTTASTNPSGITPAPLASSNTPSGVSNGEAQSNGSVTSTQNVETSAATTVGVTSVGPVTATGSTTRQASFWSMLLVFMVILSLLGGRAQASTVFPRADDVDPSAITGAKIGGFVHDAFEIVSIISDVFKISKGDLAGEYLNITESLCDFAAGEALKLAPETVYEDCEERLVGLELQQIGSDLGLVLRSYAGLGGILIEGIAAADEAAVLTADASAIPEVFIVNSLLCGALTLVIQAQIEDPAENNLCTVLIDAIQELISELSQPTSTTPSPPTSPENLAIFTQLPSTTDAEMCIVCSLVWDMQTELSDSMGLLCPNPATDYYVTAKYLVQYFCAPSVVDTEPFASLCASACQNTCQQYSAQAILLIQGTSLTGTIDNDFCQDYCGGPIGPPGLAPVALGTCPVANSEWSKSCWYGGCGGLSGCIPVDYCPGADYGCPFGCNTVDL